MMTLIVGVPDSGKSVLAEEIVLEQSEKDKRIYIATMIPFGEEGRQRVRRHKKLREGKGFFTIEAPVEVLKSARAVQGIGDATCLLECVSNLVGNVMHDGAAGRKMPEDAGKDSVSVLDDLGVERVVSDIKDLCGLCKNLVVVTNSFPRDDTSYDDDTIRYVKLMDQVNKELMGISDRLYEFREGAWISREHL